MNRTKKLVKDILLFAIASFGPNFLSFLFVPLYTSYLSTESYGMADLLNTISALLLPVLMLDISDAIMIRTVDWRSKERKEGAALRYGFVILAKSSCILFAGLIVFIALTRNESYYLYAIYIFLQYIIMALYNNLLAYLRGTDQVPVIVTAGIIQSLVTIFSNLIFIVFFQWGLVGILFATILGGVVTDIYVMVKVKIKTLISTSKLVTNEEKKGMLSYSIPLIFTGLAWWINSSSDRLFISYFLGVGINGIYAVANKIPVVLGACHNVIYQAMQLSVFSERKATDKKEYFQTLYNIYNFLMTSICCVLIILNKVLARFLFKGEFFIAWKYSPALLISIGLFSVAGYLTTIYAAESETKSIAKATVLGAGINSMLNLILITRLNLYGAVIATLVGYFVIWLVMALEAPKKIGIRLDIKISLFGYMVLCVQWLVLLYIKEYIGYAIQCVLAVLLIIMNRKTLKELYSIAKKFL